MLTIREYVKAESIAQAYELNQKKQNKILGGGVWLKCCHFPIQTAIDLSVLGLDKITETEEAFEIGCMVTLRQLETHEFTGGITLEICARRFYIDPNGPVSKGIDTVRRALNTVGGESA